MILIRPPGGKEQQEASGVVVASRIEEEEEEEEDHRLTVTHSMEVQNLIIQESQSFTIGQLTSWTAVVCQGRSIFDFLEIQKAVPRGCYIKDTGTGYYPKFDIFFV